MKEQIINLLQKSEIPFFKVSDRLSLFDKQPELKIVLYTEDRQINNVEGQYPNCVSLLLNLETLELNPQIFGGMGGRRLYLKPDLNDPKEKYLAMAGQNLPFRTPKPEKDKVLKCISTFINNYISFLKANKDRLFYPTNL